jgi:surfactin family lipopeptide synthetase C
MQRHDVEDIYELSPIQQGLLYELLKAPDTGVYVEQMTGDLVGRLDLGAFERAWQRVVDRHTILRTSFHWGESGKPLQVVHRRAQIALETFDWSAVPDGELEARYDAWLAADRMKPFELSHPPLMRITLIRGSQDRWRFSWRFSHLVMDGWSFGLAIMDWLAHYRAQVRRIAPDPIAARPYRDYVAWWTRNHPSEADHQYWRSELAGFVPPEPLHQEGDSSLPPGSATHAFLDFELGSVAAQAKEIGGERRVTANTVVQGAWSILLSRRSAAADVIAGATTVHRPHELAGAEAILGPLITTLPVRTNVQPDLRVVDWLRELQLRQAAGREHARVPLADIQQLPAVPALLLETTISNQNVPLPTIALADLDLELVDYVYDGRPHFALSLIILPGPSMPMRLVYDRRRFGRGAIAVLAAQLLGLIRAISTDPNTSIDQLPALTHLERAALENEAARALASPTGETVLDMLEKRTLERPEAEAVCAAQGRLSYRELTERAQDLASRLVMEGIGAGDRVGVCLGRSLELIVAIVAILRTGAAYVPLNPEYPVSRLAFLVDDSGVGAILTRREYLERLPDAGRITVVCINEGAVDRAERQVLESGTRVLEGHGLGPQSVMYVLYTSGSTGRPKGVPITHGDVQQFLTASLEHLQVSEQDVWSMFHDCGFDVSVLEMWGALTTGGRLVVMSPNAVRSADAMLELICEERVTVLNQTPSAFELLSVAEESAPADTCATLRWVIFIGERLDPARLRPWVARHGDERPQLINMFGITETTVASTWRRITVADVCHGSGSPIGVPLSHQRIYLLDDRGRPTQSGARGEMFIAGRSISSGYLNRSELTAERFLTDPFAPAVESMYRTGDLARRCHDGSLEYIGRRDEQLQIGGFRIEPAEVEAALLELPGVRQAAVVARAGPRGELRLLGYVAGEVSADPMALLSDRLPAFMIPATIVHLDELPLNQAGKVDRRALPQPPQPVHRDGEYATPRTEVEATLVKLVREALELDDLGVFDDLREHAMHSLDVMRIAVRARRTLNVALPLKALYANSTIAALADAVEASRREGLRS